MEERIYSTILTFLSTAVALRPEEEELGLELAL